MNRIARAFDRAADYDAHADVQRQVAAMLAQRIAALSLPGRPHILEIGCGTGFLGAELIERFPGADWLMTDIAPMMVKRTHARFADRPNVRTALMNGEEPDRANRYDLVCSSLAAQWFADLPAAVARLRTLLRPGGWLAIATLADGSFAEWRNAHPAGSEPGLHRYPSIAELGSSDETRIAVCHEHARAFLRALKGIGAGTPRVGHRPLPPTALRETMRRFEAAGAIATYHIAFLMVAA